MLPKFTEKVNFHRIYTHDMTWGNVKMAVDFMPGESNSRLGIVALGRLVEV